MKIIFELLINEITIIFDQTFSFLISLCLNTVFVHHKNKNKFMFEYAFKFPSHVLFMFDSNDHLEKLHE